MLILIMDNSLWLHSLTNEEFVVVIVGELVGSYVGSSVICIGTSVGSVVGDCVGPVGASP